MISDSGAQGNDVALDLRLAMDVVIGIGEALDAGLTAHGGRRIVPLLGGRFTGPNVRGIVLPGGADWNLRRADDVREVMARFTLQTDDGVLISVTNTGLTRGAYGTPERYSRMVPSFEVTGERYGWLQQSVFVGTQARADDEYGAPTVRLTYYEVL